MLGVTKILCETYETAERINRSKEPGLLQFSSEKRPVIVWNITKRCNLRCNHCYSDSLDRYYSNELTTEEAISVIDDLARFGTPVIIFSGGEPLMRDDIFDLADYSRGKGIRCVLSTNGVLIGKKTVRRIKDAGFSYVGVSIDGIDRINDLFRGMKGAYHSALAGLRNLRDEGIGTGLRFTLNRRTLSQLKYIFEISEHEDIPRIYISHLVYSGRGERIKNWDLNHYETRHAVNYIFNKAIDFHNRGIKKDILTGNNDADGVYLYQRTLSKDPAKAEVIYRLLKMRGGNSSGVAIGCIDNVGEVHADQFWSHYSFGNVRNRPFSEIWTDTGNPVMRGLKDKLNMVKGRCRMCKFLEICGGNYRVRGESVFGDIWAEDPACYLTDAETGIYGERQPQGMQAKSGLEVVNSREVNPSRV